MRLIIRGVPLELDEAVVTDAIGGPAKRFLRTRGATARAMPMMSVICQDPIRCKQLLQDGVTLHGVHCAVELPLCEEGSAAVSGRLVGAREQARSVDDLQVQKGYRVGFLSNRPVARDDRAFVRKCGTVSVVEVAKDGVTVEDGSGTLRRCSRSEVKRGLAASADARLVVCSTTGEYRRLAQTEMRAGEAALEVGCDLGAACGSASTYRDRQVPAASCRNAKLCSC